MEKVVSSVDGKIALHYENCRRLKIRIDKLDQIYRAPSVYAQLCAEVCRRRKFALEYKHVSILMILFDTICDLLVLTPNIYRVVPLG